MPPPPDPERVELHTAYCWDCPTCGSHNFADSQRAELTDDERAELYRIVGIEKDDGDAWKGEEPAMVEGCELVTHPDRVTCAKCGEAFNVEKPESPLPPDFDPHRDLNP